MGLLEAFDRDVDGSLYHSVGMLEKWEDDLQAGE